MDQDLQVLGNQLVKAAQNGNNETTKALLTQGAPVDAKDKNGATPLMCASLNGRKDVCKLLLAQKAHVDSRNNDDSTLLVLTTRWSRKDLCELLLTYKANVHANANDGFTPFIWAAINGHVDVCKCLIDAMSQKQDEFKKNKQAIIIVLGLRKKSKCLGLIGHNMVQYIAQMVFDMAQQDNVNVVAQINAIKNNALKTELLNYYQTQLRILQGTQPKEYRE
jgi:hypothetical protein